MNREALALTLISAGALLLSRTASAANIESSDAIGALSLDVLTDRAERAYNVLTEQAADVSADVAGRNLQAFLQILKRAEGTANQADPYRVCYGYAHTIRSLSDHPAVTGEWRGERLPDAMCVKAGFNPGCVSTAAGAYQIIRPTWLSVKEALGLANFGPASQDAAAVELIRRRGALEDVKAGRVAVAIEKCRNEWASLPGNYAGQGQRSMGELVAWYQQSGGLTA